MDSPIAAAAVGLFAGTNIDDMVVLAVLNASSRADGRPRRWQIWVGQYLGVAVLVVISLLAAVGLTLVSESWIWLLGLIPLGLGIRKLVIALRATRSGDSVSPAVVTGLAGVVGLTVANGGDNIAAYTPVFRTIGPGGIIVILGVFVIGVALWCLIGAWLVSHHGIAEAIRRWGQWIVPAVYILIGLSIFGKGGLLGF
jgi:cadmium resistance protein CadD (predicted permease)